MKTYTKITGFKSFKELKKNCQRGSEYSFSDYSKAISNWTTGSQVFFIHVADMIASRLMDD